MTHGTSVALNGFPQRVRAVRPSRDHDLTRCLVCPEPEPLRPALERAQNELDSRLAEACEDHEADESTGKLIRLEELLTDAAQAAKEAISIRRRLGADRRQQESPDPTRSERLAASSAPEQVEGIRDFVDADGRLWHVWEVPPEQLSARARPGTYAGDFEGGWLAFEAAEGGERRRLPGYPRDWHQLANERIEALCREARPVTRRRRPADGAPNASEDDTTTAG